MDYNTALNIALNTASGTPPYYAAEALCVIRGIDPWGASPTGPPNWQVVIMEQLLGHAIVEELAPRGSI